MEKDEECDFSLDELTPEVKTALKIAEEFRPVIEFFGAKTGLDFSDSRRWLRNVIIMARNGQNIEDLNPMVDSIYLGMKPVAGQTVDPNDEYSHLSLMYEEDVFKAPQGY